jgi:hypothetical protein
LDIIFKNAQQDIRQKKLSLQSSYAHREANMHYLIKPSFKPYFDLFEDADPEAFYDMFELEEPHRSLCSYCQECGFAGW